MSNSTCGCENQDCSCENNLNLLFPGADGFYTVVKGDGSRIKVDPMVKENGHPTYYVRYEEYIPLTINSFTRSVPAGLSLLGATVTDVTLNWQYNKAVETQAITALGQTIPAIVAGDRSAALTGLSITADTTFTLTADDNATDHIPAITATVDVLFGNNVYIGKTAEALSSSTPSSDVITIIQGLTNKPIQQTRAGNFTCSSLKNEFDLYAYPARFGEGIFKGATNPGPGGFILLGAYNITNTAAYTESYYVYRSAYDFLNGANFSVS